MTLTDKEIKHLEKLARIRLSDEAREKLKGQLSDIIRFVQKLQRTDTENIGIDVDIENAEQYLREGEGGGELDRDRVLKEAPEAQAGYFKVPPVIDADTDS